MFWRIFAQTIWQKEVSMEKELDLLIATEMSGDGDSVAEELRSVFAKRGVTVHRIEFRSGKDSVIRSVRANPQIHAVVLSQYQDQEKLSPRDIDQICSTAEGDLQVFVVVSEMRGSDYMKEIESLGIYTAVYQEDASFEKIAEWYCNGRTKKEARAYYGVAGGDHVVQYRNIDVNASIQYLLEYDGSYTDLIQRMSVLVNGIPASQVASIVCQLPDPICEMLKREPRFALICQMAEEQYAYLYKPSGQPEKEEAGEKADTGGEEQPKNKAIRRFFKRKQEEPTERKPAKRQACEIGVMATNIGVGCTTISILLANTLAHEGKRAAIVELDDADGCFEQLCRQEREEEQVDGITKFAIGTLDYYYHVPLQKFQLDYKPLYDFIVYDFGCLDQETIFHVYAMMQNRFIVTSKAEWKQHELKELLKDIKGMPGEDECRVLISSHCGGSDLGDVKELMPENTILAAIPYESNPFYPGKACRQIFLKLLDGTYKEEKYKKSDSVEQRFSERPRDFKKFGIQIVMGALLVACMGFMVSACSANNRYNRMVTKADTFITGLGTLEDTGFKIASRVEDNTSLFDMIENALDLTLQNTKEMFVLYDDFGKLTLKNLGSMYVGEPGAYLMIDEETGENFEYTSSIDSDTYNKIKLTYDNESTGKREVYIAQDGIHINEWGVLQYFDTLSKGENGQAKADALLQLYNKKTRNLKIVNALGDTRVRAGSMVVINLALGDMNLKNFMLVEKVKHTFKLDQHFMDLTLRGGEFVA